MPPGLRSGAEAACPVQCEPCGVTPEPGTVRKTFWLLPGLLTLQLPGVRLWAARTLAFVFVS